jgi:molybdopterin adenylyltransferase
VSVGYEEHMKQARANLPCAVLTISDTRTKDNDGSGEIIIRGLEANGHRVIEYAILPDSMTGIREAVSGLLNREEVKVIIVNGGTGITRRDVTVEAVEPLLDKRLDGFGELFRFLSYQEIGPAAIMSRAMGGLAGGRIILCLPGSTGAVRLAMERIVLPQIGHMVLEAEK